MSARFPELAPGAMNEAQKAVHDAMTSGPRGAVVGPFPVLLRTPELADAVQRLGANLRYAGLLSDQLREIAILTVSRRWAAQFEWFAHHPIAIAAGVDAEALERLRRGENPRFGDESQQLVWRTSRIIVDEGRLSDVEFAEAKAGLGESELVELLTVLGYYTLLSFILNVGDVAVPGPQPFPDAG